MCRAAALASLLKSAENGARVAFPFAAASAAHFPSVRAETQAGVAAVIGPRFHANARVSRAVAVTGRSLVKWSADCWKRPRLRAGLGLRGGKLMKYLVLLHVRHTGGFWPNYWRQSAQAAPMAPSRSFICWSKWVHLTFILITRSLTRWQLPLSADISILICSPR